MKKILVALLSISMLLSSSILVGAVPKNHTTDGFKYTIVEGKYARIEGIEESPKILEIPSMIDGYEVRYIDSLIFSTTEFYPDSIIIPDTVTYIASSAFRGRKEPAHGLDVSDVKEVVLSSNLTYIGDSAFEYCYNLESIIIPDSVVYIGKNAFRNCTSLTEVYIPGSVDNLSERAFENCDNLQEVVFGEGVTIIEEYAFNSCDSLKNVKFPESMSWISKGAFLDCKKLKKVKLDEYITTEEDSFGRYTNKKGKVKTIEEFKMIRHESVLHSISNYANYYGCKSVYFMDADATEKLTCEKGIKTKLRIDGKEVVSWKSSKPEVAKITADGKFKAKAKGTTKLTAKLSDGTTYTRKVKVR